jgi:hypothetical protein
MVESSFQINRTQVANLCHPGSALREAAVGAEHLAVDPAAAKTQNEKRKMQNDEESTGRMPGPAGRGVRPRPDLHGCQGQTARNAECRTTRKRGRARASGLPMPPEDSSGRLPVSPTRPEWSGCMR